MLVHNRIYDISIKESLDIDFSHRNARNVKYRLDLSSRLSWRKNLSIKIHRLSTRLAVYQRCFTRQNDTSRNENVFSQLFQLAKYFVFPMKLTRGLAERDQEG